MARDRGGGCPRDDRQHARGVWDAPGPLHRGAGPRDRRVLLRGGCPGGAGHGGSAVVAGCRPADGTGAVAPRPQSGGSAPTAGGGCACGPDPERAVLHRVPARPVLLLPAGWRDRADGRLHQPVSEGKDSLDIRRIEFGPGRLYVKRRAGGIRSRVPPIRGASPPCGGPSRWRTRRQAADGRDRGQRCARPRQDR